MFYTEYIILFLMIALSSLFGWSFFCKIRFDHFYKTALKAFLEKEDLFSSFAIRQAVLFLIKKKHKKALIYLCFGRTGLAKKVFESKLLEKRCEFPPRGGFKGRYGEALELYAKAQVELKDGNMLPASENCLRAVKLFEREKAFIECGYTRILLGTIYRLSAVEDVAEIMLRSALEIFQKTGCFRGEVKALGNLGMLMTMEERLDEAVDYFEKSLKISTERGLRVSEAEVLNQIGLFYLINNDFENAVTKTELAMLINKQEKNEIGLSFSLDIMAQILHRQKEHEKAIKILEKAIKIHKKNNNFSALFEALYIKALILVEQEKFDDAEGALRQIVDGFKEVESSFHIANAYHLLGLIFLKKGDLKRAKGLFRQSLDMESKNERLSGAAVDYANIGLIENRIGNKEQARKNLEAALEYACAFGENELSCMIKERLEEM